MANAEPGVQRGLRRHRSAESPAFVVTGSTRRPIGMRGTDTAACLVSGLFHAVLLVLLALYVVPTIIGQDGVSLSSSMVSQYELLDAAGQDELESLAGIEVEPSADVEVPYSASLHVGIDLTHDRNEAAPSPLSPNQFESVDLGGDRTSSVGIAIEAASVEGAVDTVTGRIKGQLERGDLLVVWLLDASHSLVDDRRRVAEQLEPFFDGLTAGRGDPDDHRLLNAVVSFGKSMRQQVEPTTSVRRVINAVEKLPIDTSGEENVLAAIARCVQEYREPSAGRQLMIVVWMDETGDDTELLEETIALCRAHHVSVSVVGPSSVLGAKTGLHSYRDPNSNEVFQLPVTRGPDSALSERIDVGYWFLTRPPAAEGRLQRGLVLPSWYGGPHLKGIVSGFSPYALTRLAATTGGTYTIFDRPEDRGPFRSDAMRAYAPEYQSVEEYRKVLAAHPLRRALHQAVQVTAAKKLMPPETMLFVTRDELRPQRIARPYMTAVQFARKLRSSRRALQRTADSQSRTIEEALALLSQQRSSDRDLDAEFAQEQSPRWRAWHDLTRGRLLAVSVRLEEYRLALGEIAQDDVLQDTTNHVMLLPSRKMRSGSSFQTRAAEAARLLQRCVEEHPGTPWAYLAERELAYGLGIVIRQQALTRIPSTPAAPRASLPRL